MPTYHSPTFVSFIVATVYEQGQKHNYEELTTHASQRPMAKLDNAFIGLLLILTE